MEGTRAGVFPELLEPVTFWMDWARRKLLTALSYLSLRCLIEHASFNGRADGVSLVRNHSLVPRPHVQQVQLETLLHVRLLE